MLTKLLVCSMCRPALLLPASCFGKTFCPQGSQELHCLFLTLGTWESVASATAVLHLQTRGRQGLSVCLHGHCSLAHNQTLGDAAWNNGRPEQGSGLHRLVLNLGLPTCEPCNLRQVTWQLCLSYDGNSTSHSLAQYLNHTLCLVSASYTKSKGD